MEDGTWPGGTGENFDPNKRYGEPKRIGELIRFMKDLDGMEEYLMKTAYESIEDDMNIFRLYPQNEIENLAIQDLIHYFSDREEYEKCALIVKYLEEGELHNLLQKTMPSNESKE